MDAASGILTISKPLNNSDDTRCCINIIQPLDDENIMLETCTGL